MNYILIEPRKDRLGSRFCCVLADLIYCKSKNIVPVIIYKERDIFFITLYSFIYNYDNTKKISNIPFTGCVRSHYSGAVLSIKQDIPSYFKEHFFKDYHTMLKQCIVKRGYKLPWKDNSKIICIHVRLDDVAKLGWKDYDGTVSENYLKSAINEDDINKIYKWNGTSARLDQPSVTKEHGHDYQAPIDPNKLNNIIEMFKNMYPDKEIHIVKRGNFNDYYKSVLDKHNDLIIHENNPEYDLWLLINSDILMLAKSLFSNMAAILHLGSQVYAPIWGTTAAFGVTSKYNKSTWKFYV